MRYHYSHINLRNDFTSGKADYSCFAYHSSGRIRVNKFKIKAKAGQPVPAVQTADGACPALGCGDPWSLDFGSSTGSVTGQSGSPSRVEGHSYFYNSKEKLADLGLNLYEYGFRWHAPQLGRFVQVDPLAMDYAYKSTYDYTENAPINAIDLDGLEKLITIGVGGNPIYSSGLDRGQIPSKIIQYDISKIVPRKITRDSQWYNDLLEFISGGVGIDIRGSGPNEFGAVMNMGKERTKDMRVVIMNLAENNEISLLLDLHSAISASPNTSRAGWGEDFKTMADFLDKIIDQTVPNHPIFKNERFTPHESIKGGFYRDNKKSYCPDCHYKSKDGGTGYDVFGGKEYQDVYFPDYKKIIMEWKRRRYRGRKRMNSITQENQLLLNEKIF